jgi:hypothetical protein
MILHEYEINQNNLDLLCDKNGYSLAYGSDILEATTIYWNDL